MFKPPSKQLAQQLNGNNKRPVLITLSGTTKKTSLTPQRVRPLRRRQTRLRLTTNDSDNSSDANESAAPRPHKKTVISSSSDDDEEEDLNERDNDNYSDDDELLKTPHSTRRLVINDDGSAGKRLLKASVVREEEELKHRSALKSRNQAALLALKQSQRTNTAAARRRLKHSTAADDADEMESLQSSSGSSSDSISDIGGEDEDNEQLDAELRQRELQPLRKSNTAKVKRSSRVVKMQVIDQDSASGESDDVIGDEDVDDEDEEDEDEEDGFIVRGGQHKEWQSMMPMRFSGMSKQPLSSLFPILIQLVAGEHLNQGFIRGCLRDSEDPYFTFASDKLDSVVESLKDSLVKSQCWSDEFGGIIKTLPEFNFSEIAQEFGCDACNRRNRISSKQITISGIPYNRKTLLSRKGKERQSLTFQVGKECFRRVQLYHELHHYRYHLMQRVAEELDALKPPSFNPEDGDQQSALVMELLEDSVIMSQLFNEFKELMERAETCYSTQ